MRVWDVSWNLDVNPPCYPDDRKPSVNSIASSERWVTSNIDISSHSGTHIDFPRHFIPNGAKSSSFSPEVFVGEVRLLEISSDTVINAQFLRNSNISQRRLFFKTNGDVSKPLTPDGAEFLSKKNMLLVGIDTLSIDGSNSDCEAHDILLSNGILIVENLNLNAVSEGTYMLICLPLPFADIDGSPCRAILIALDYWNDFVRDNKI